MTDDSSETPDAQAELRIKISSEDNITVQKRVNDDAEEGVKERVERIEKGLADYSLTDLRICGGGEPRESEDMDHERLWRGESLDWA